MMKVRKTQSYLVNVFDVEMVYKALLSHKDALTHFKNWMSTEEVECSHCGGQSAIKNIEEEIREYSELIMHIYMKCFNKHTQMPVERPKGLHAKKEDTDNE
jgi:hypothetical protein